jgi:hypothetical protein
MAGRTERSAPRVAWLALLAVAGVVLAAFHPLWLWGDSCMAAQSSPGVTVRGPLAATAYGQLPLADAVAAYIDEPQAVLASRQLAAGHWPWWNPHNGLGVPLFGNWQSALLSPLRLLVLLFPDSTWAFDFTYVLRLLVAGVGACLLALRLGLPAAGAAACGVSFALTGYFLRYLSMHHLNAEVWLPFLWWAADRLAVQRRVKDLLVFVGVTFSVVVGGNPQPVLIAALGTAGFWLWRRRPWGARGLLVVLAAGIPAVCLASSYWLAGLEYVRESVHHHDATFGRDGYTAASALGFLLSRPYAEPAFNLVAPHFGFVPVVLALLGLGVGLGRSWFLWLALIVGAGKLANLWGTQWLGTLPGLSMMKIFKYGYPLPALALALLAGNGAVHLATLPARAVVVRASAALGLLVLLLLAGMRADRAAATLTLQATGDVVFRVVLLGVLLGTWRLPAAARAWLAAAVLAGELVAAYPTRWLPRHAPFAKPPVLAAMHERPAASRTFGAVGIFIPNQNVVFGQDDIRLHDGVFPRRYGKFVRQFLNPNVRTWPVFTGEDLGERPDELMRLGHELHALLLPQGVAADVRKSTPVDITAPTPGRYFDLVNVEYFVLPALVKPLVEGWSQEHFRLEHADADALLVKRRTVLPRAFFPTRVEQVADEDAAFAAMARDDYVPREVAYLEGDLADAGSGISGSARVESRPAPADLIIAAQVAAPAWLVVSVYPYPGLTASVDGAPATLVPANGTLSAVRVPRGRHVVRLTYEPQTLPWARGLSWLGAGMLLALAFALARHPRQQQQGV